MTLPPQAHPEKTRWRKAVTELFSLVPPPGRKSLDSSLNQRLADYLSGVAPGLALGFFPLPDEPDITPALGEWLRRGGRLALPVWHGGSGMAFRLVTDLERDVEPGKSGILTPKPALEEADPRQATLALVPGRAFGEDRLRLGRGAGCYDVLFSFRKLLKIGIAYDFQIFPVLPADAWDVPMDVILTPARTIVENGVLQSRRML